MTLALIVAVAAPIGALFLFARLIFLIRRPKHASLAKWMLGIGMITAVVNTVIGATEVQFGHDAIFMLLFMPAWGFLLGALATLVVSWALGRLQLTMRGWKMLGASLLVVTAASAVPFDTPVAPAARLVVVDTSGAPVPSACARASWSYQLLNDHYEGDDHLSGADGLIRLPARVVHASALSRAANFWILGGSPFPHPAASVRVFSMDESGHLALAADVDTLRASELRLVMRPDPYIPRNLAVSPCTASRLDRGD